MATHITLRKRINAVLALSIVFLLILVTNRIDQKHVDVAQNSVKEVYNDRVLVQNYIFSISNILFAKQLALKDSLFENDDDHQNRNLEQLLADFHATKLTSKEAIHLKSLQDNLEVLRKLENQKIQHEGDSGLLKNKIAGTLATMHANLYDLSKIQIHESRYLTSSAQKSLDTSEFLSNLEIGGLIFIGIVIQFILFYRRKKGSESYHANRRKNQFQSTENRSPNIPYPSRYGSKTFTHNSISEICKN
ncbi:MAG TPA: hypothetical protein ENH91_16140 [Leeuwenhoekiella sp.]|nr:hypothetical protein [Leeuwenhoekiella sp.]